MLLMGAVFGSEDEFRLIQDLRNNYDPIERPVRNHSEPIRVDLRIILQQLVDVYLTVRRSSEPKGRS
ncbi:hypothetical protein NECAME_02165 [Necator americanus]|uniref:Neurotransmitter-gated ion-channel ligand-binding domain-containing protein n=1 Tax=Necator americanus TaxID=51031 RepID=W2THF1_NECAM|nr:hypothetical protein NECAME_02165 [Necator americanus]ETN81485.1 hypothetical protein NECAME_02165 [Necator americanus]